MPEGHVRPGNANDRPRESGGTGRRSQVGEKPCNACLEAAYEDLNGVLIMPVTDEIITWWPDFRSI